MDKVVQVQIVEDGAIVSMDLRYTGGRRWRGLVNTARTSIRLTLGRDNITASRY